MGEALRDPDAVCVYRSCQKSRSAQTLDPKLMLPVPAWAGLACTLLKTPLSHTSMPYLLCRISSEDRTRVFFRRLCSLLQNSHSGCVCNTSLHTSFKRFWQWVPFWAGRGVKKGKTDESWFFRTHSIRLLQCWWISNVFHMCWVFSGHKKSHSWVYLCRFHIDTGSLHGIRFVFLFVTGDYYLLFDLHNAHEITQVKSVKSC